MFRKLRSSVLLLGALALLLASCGQKPDSGDSITGLVLVPGSLELEVGESSDPIVVSVAYESGRTVALEVVDVDWASSDEDVATVDGGGVVTGVAAGRATVTVSHEESGFEMAADVTVVEPEPTDEEPGGDEKPGDGEEPGEGEEPGNGEEPGEGEDPGEGEQPGEGENPSEGEEPAPAVKVQISVTGETELFYIDDGTDIISETTELQATVTGSSNTGVTWSANPSDSVEITDAGSGSVTVAALKEGDVTITATSDADSGASAKIEISIEEAAEFDDKEVYVGPVIRMEDAAEGTKLHPFRSIQEGIDEVADGGIVYIAAYTYEENLEILDDNARKKITLKGESQDKVIVDGRNKRPTVFGLEVDGVEELTLEQMTFTGAERNLKIENSSKVKLENITAEASDATNIDFFKTTNVTLNNVTAVAAAAGVGISFKDGSGLELINVSTSSNAWGGVSFYSTGPVNGDTGIQEATISMDSSFGETVPVYTELDAADGEFSGLNFAGFEFAVRNPAHKTDGDHYTFYYRDIDAAAEYALDINNPNQSTIQTLATNDHAVLENTFLIAKGMSARAAMDAIAEDGRIEFQDGKHEFNGNNFKITTNGLTLTGTPGHQITTVKAGGSGQYIFEIEAANVTIKHMNFVALDGAASSGALSFIGLSKANSSHARIENNTFKGLYDENNNDIPIRGLRLVPGATSQPISVINNTFEGLAHAGYVAGRTGGGSTDVVIRSNRAIGTKGWVFEKASAGMSITDNSFEKHNSAGNHFTFSVGADPVYELEATLDALHQSNGGSTIRLAYMSPVRYYPPRP